MYVTKAAGRPDGRPALCIGLQVATRQVDLQSEEVRSYLQILLIGKFFFAVWDESRTFAAVFTSKTRNLVKLPTDRPTLEDVARFID